MFIMNSCHLLVLLVQNKKEAAPNHGTTSNISIIFLTIYAFLPLHLLKFYA